MSDLFAALNGDRTTEVWPLFIHAHPDDEVLQTGALLAWCHEVNISVEVLTCTRGERGEMVPGVMPETITTEDLVKVRERELACALDNLGVTGRHWLGQPPARRHDLTPRRYSDSGMRWISEGIAGPAVDADPDSFTSADIQEATDDLVALVKHLKPTVIISYDQQGSYGHPDHIRAHQISKRAAQLTGIAMIEIASDQTDESFEWFDLSRFADQVKDALRCHSTQLTVFDDHLVHVGGQRQEIPTRIGLRYLS